jgi:tRNA(His) guanylyltransferase
VFDSLGNRMKSFEAPWRSQLPPRMPVIIRVDGKAFHSYTRGLSRPFCEDFCAAMDCVAVALCEEIQGAKIAYVQSDEISVLVHTYRTFESQAWFDNDVQKMASVSAAVASARMTGISPSVFGEVREARFDSRCFVLPESEVANAFLWRQNDASRNSIQMLARSLASHKECDGLGQAELQELCFQRGNNWNDLPARYRRGRCVVRQTHELDGVIRHEWVVDNEIPIWKGDGRQYIERLLVCDDEKAGAA